MDAADHSVGDYGSTHGTGSHLVHGNVDEKALGEISGGFSYTMKNKNVSRHHDGVWIYLILFRTQWGLSLLCDD